MATTSDTATPRRAVKSFWKRVERFEAANVEAAEIIACDPVRYPSPALQTWARMVLQRERERRLEAA